MRAVSAAPLANAPLSLSLCLLLLHFLTASLAAAPLALGLSHCAPCCASRRASDCFAPRCASLTAARSVALAQRRVSTASHWHDAAMVQRHVGRRCSVGVALRPRICVASCGKKLIAVINYSNSNKLIVIN